MVFNATSKIFQLYHGSLFYWGEETGVPGENHSPVASHLQALSHVVSNTPLNERGFELTTLVLIGPHCSGSCKSNYQTITTTATPYCL